MGGQLRFPGHNASFQMLEKMAEGHIGSYLRRMIERLPLFAESDPAFLDALCDGLEEKTFAPGEIVAHEENPMTHAVLVLISGTFTMYVGGTEIGDIEAGELAIFGEISGLGIGRWCPATLLCAKQNPCLVVEIVQSVFEEAPESHPKEFARFQNMDDRRRQRASKALHAHVS